jgi:uncharacterized membrane protein
MSDWQNVSDTCHHAGKSPNDIYGPVAQLVERLICTEEVAGSSPVRSTMKLETLKNVVAPLILFLAILGVADTAYLTYSHFNDAPVFCTTGSECEFVLTSEYSEFLGIPVALFGFLYYLIILILVSIFLHKEDKKFIAIISKISPLGLIASAWFVYAQLFVLYAICTYCMVSAGISTAIFIIGMIYLYLSRNSSRIFTQNETNNVV